MIQNVLQHIGGIENYGVLSIVLFFLVFLGTLVWALRLKKPTNRSYLQIIKSVAVAAYKTARPK